MRKIDRFVTTVLMYLVLFTACGFGYALGMIAPRDSTQKPHKEDVQEFIRQELEAKRVEVTVWKERWAREYESRKGLEGQISQIRAAVAKAAKL